MSISSVLRGPHGPFQLFLALPLSYFFPQILVDCGLNQEQKLQQEKQYNSRKKMLETDFCGGKVGYYWISLSLKIDFQCFLRVNKKIKIFSLISAIEIFLLSMHSFRIVFHLWKAITKVEKLHFHTNRLALDLCQSTLICSGLFWGKAIAPDLRVSSIPSDRAVQWPSG